MKILEFQTLTGGQALDVQVLIGELEPGLNVSSDWLVKVAASPDTHFFAAVDDVEHIVGCATLCVCDTPTGRKAHVEDVVVSSACRGQHIGKRLMEHIIDYARRELGQVDLLLTSRPHRVAANTLYRSLGFRQRETNVYKLEIYDH